MDEFPRTWPVDDSKFLQRRATEAAAKQTEQLDDLKAMTREVHTATVAVQNAVVQMADETTRVQKLALWVAVGTALLGAVVGGFAGAIAAQIVGG